MKSQRLRDRDEADRLASLITRSVGSCERCGRTTDLDCSHIYPRTYNSTRCYLPNLKCFCRRCHELWGTWTYTERRDWLTAHRTPAELAELDRRVHDPTKTDFGPIRAELATIWKEIQNAR